MRIYDLEIGGRIRLGIASTARRGAGSVEEPDRNALVLRFLSRLEFKAVGEALGGSPMRRHGSGWSRALERLRGC